MNSGRDDALLWAARLGEVCGRAGEGPVPERALLDAWMELVGARAAALTLVRAGGGEECYSRGLQPWCRAPADPGVSLTDASRLGGEGQVLRLAFGVPAGPWAELLTDGADEALLARVEPLSPLLEGALLRLARERSASVDSAARRAWEQAPGAMVLLSDALVVLAMNPAAARHEGLAIGSALPGWVQGGVDATEHSSGSTRRVWTVADDGVEYNLSVVAVDPAEATPGRWLLSLMQGGPRLDERVQLAEVRYGLTLREAEVLELVAEGLTNQQVADALELVEATVKFHLNGAMKKVGVGSRTELLARLHSVHLVDARPGVPTHARRINHGWLWMGEDGILRVDHDPGTRMEVDDIRAFNAAVESYFEGTPLLVFSDASGIRSSSSEAHKLAAQPLHFVAALAVKGGSAVSRALVNLFLRVSRPPYPTRLFDDEVTAVAWLKTLPRVSPVPPPSDD